MLKVYLEDVWEEIITERGIELLYDKGVDVESNLFGQERDFDEVESVDLLIATKPDLKLVNRAVEQGIKVIFYSLFPDQILGWDYSNNTYKNVLPDDFQKDINQLDLFLVNSEFTKGLLSDYVDQSQKLNVCYLGIDYKSISNMETGDRARIRVLWNHMWREDKGFRDALKITSRLAERFPKVDFFIGRKGSFTGKKIDEMNSAYNSFLDEMKNKDLKNIYLIDYFQKQSSYWKFLKSIDISFSCSYHETFGISMLEQQAAGVACVVPSWEVYPEIHKGSLFVSPHKIEEGVSQLIEDPKLLTKVSTNCMKNASQYDVSNFVINLHNFIKKVI